MPHIDNDLNTPSTKRSVLDYIGETLGLNNILPMINAVITLPSLIVDVFSIYASQELIRNKFEESLNEYLCDKPNLNAILTNIKTWMERTKQRKRLFSDQEKNIEQKVLDKIREKINKEADTEISDRVIEQLKVKFYDIPIFLYEFEYLVSEFANDPTNIYQIQSGITTLQEHIKFFKRESLKKKLAVYREILTNYDQIIEKIIEDKIQCNKTNMNRAVFISIIEQLKDDKDKLTAFLQQVRENQHENIHIRLSAHLQQIIQMYEENQPCGEILTEMATLGSAEDVMWLLCQDYNRSLNRNVRKGIGNLILFLSKQGVKPEECVRKNMSAAELLHTANYVGSKKENKEEKKKENEEERKEIDIVKLNAISNKALLKRYNNKKSLVQAVYETMLSQTFGYFIIVLPLTIMFQALLISAAVGFPVILGAYILPIIFHDEISNFIHRKDFIPPAENPAKKLTIGEKNTFSDFFIPSKKPSHLLKAISPITKIANIFKTITKPYVMNTIESQSNLVKDIYQPFEGMKHILKGAFKILSVVVSLFDRQRSWSSIGAQAMNGFFTMVRGAAEIISTPYTYLIKIPTRMYITVTKTKESNMKDSAEKLKKAVEIQRQEPNIKDATDHSPQKIREALYNQAANLHQQAKELRTVSPEKTPFKEREKAEWKKIKSAFFAGIKQEQTAISEDERVLLREYSKVFTM